MGLVARTLAVQFNDMSFVKRKLAVQFNHMGLVARKMQLFIYIGFVIKTCSSVQLHGLCKKKTSSSV